MMMTDLRARASLVNASEIFDGQTWYYGLEAGSVEVDDKRGLVSFIVRWRNTTKRSRITLSLDQVRGYRENL